MVRARDYGLLDVVAQPEALVTRDRLRAARSFVREFAQVGASYYLECRLGRARSERLDLLVGFARGKQHVLAQWLAQRAGAGAAHGPLAGLRRASDAWNGASTLSNALSGLWLEYDDVRADDAPRVPSVCACMVSGYDDPRAPLPPLAAREAVPQMTAMAEVLTGRPIAPDDAAALARCLEALPATGRAIHLSAMLGRKGIPLKLYCVVPRHGLLAFLDRAGWRGPRAAVEQLVAQFCPVERVADALYVDLTVTGFSAPDGSLLGIAFAPQHLTRSRERDPGRAPLLDACTRAGLCTERESAAVQRWPGRHLRELEMGAQAALVIEQWLDLKLVWSPTAPLALKAYLGARYRGATTFDRAALASGAEQLRQIGARAREEQPPAARARVRNGLC